jgi:DeoR/GlpR family transcriptional regulator of sugar metabolism
LFLLLFIFVLEELDLLRVVRGGVVILYSERLANKEEEREESLQPKRMLAECEMSASGIQECDTVP